MQDPGIGAVFIEHKFLVSGDSYLPNGVTESKTKKKGIYLLSTRLARFSSTAKKNNQFQVTEMKQEEFLSTTKLEDCNYNRKTNTEGGKVNWLNIKWLRYCKHQSNSIFYEETLHDFPFYEINISKLASRGRFPNLLRTYCTQRENPPKMKKHDLLRYILPCYDPFYKCLPTINQKTRASTPKVKQNNVDAEMIVKVIIQMNT